MDPRQTRIALFSMLAVVLAVLASPLSGSRFTCAEDPAAVQPQFQASRAFETIREFVSRYPRRVIGSIEARQSTGFIQERLRSLGYAVSYSHFTAVVAGHRQVGRNIYGFRAGRSPEVVAVAAHYDTATTTHQGAMDDGSGVGVMLELASLSARMPAQRGLLFAATDGEEWGMLGARELVNHPPAQGNMVAAVSLDYVATDGLSCMLLDTMGQTGGYTPPWLRLLARGAVEAERLPLLEPSGLQEFLERALPLSGTEQGPFLNSGIPAVNLGSASADRSLEAAAYHAEDVVENLRIDSIDRYGRAAERLLRTLAESPAIPRQSMGYFREFGNVFLPPAMVSGLQILAFAPLLVVAIFHVGNHKRFLSTGRIRRELSAFLGTVLPFLLAYGLILLLTLLRRLPGYSLYPAPPKDPVLDHPHWGPLSGIFITAVLLATAIFFLVKFLNRGLPRPDFYASKSMLLVCFCVVIALALAHNTYWAVSFLLLPAWLWALLGLGVGPGGRAANRLLILAAGIVYYMAFISYANRLGMGWRLIWYEVLALGSGAFTWQGYVLSACTAALGIRFLAIQSYSSVD